LTADLLTAAERKKTRAAPVVNNMIIWQRGLLVC
jgi:hypothetical protein